MVKKDQILELEITSMTHEGMGVGKADGFAVFVQNAIIGERVMAKVIKVLKNYAVARINSFIEKSPERTEPFCPVYKRCGGCSLQHMSYKKTLEFKSQVVADNLARIGGLTGLVIHPAIGMEKPVNYRNKAQYPVGMGIDGPISGFYARRSHEIADVPHCAIQHTLSDKAKAIIMDYIETFRVPVYDESSGQGLIRHVVTKIGFKTGQVMVIIVAAKPSIPQKDKLIQRLIREIPGLTSVVLNVNSKPGNVILGNHNITLYGNGVIEDTLGGLTFEISPLSFYQVNPVQTEVLYGKAIEYAALTGQETVYDLYCGIGTIALLAAGMAKKVIGVEVIPEALEAAKRNAAKNGMSNVEFYTGDVENILPKLCLNENYTYELAGEACLRGESDNLQLADVVFIDPPRKGCDEALLKALAEIAPKRIVYVSCNPSTLARDLKYLTARGYEVKEVQPVDMFPWTEHVETVVELERR